MSKIKKHLLTALMWLLRGLGILIALLIAGLIVIHELTSQGEEELILIIKTRWTE